MASWLPAQKEVCLRPGSNLDHSRSLRLGINTLPTILSLRYYTAFAVREYSARKEQVLAGKYLFLIITVIVRVVHLVRINVNLLIKIFSTAKFSSHLFLDMLLEFFCLLFSLPSNILRKPFHRIVYLVCLVVKRLSPTWSSASY